MDNESSAKVTRTHSGERIFSSVTDVEQAGYIHNKNKIRFLCYIQSSTQNRIKT